MTAYWTIQAKNNYKNHIFLYFILKSDYLQRPFQVDFKVVWKMTDT